MNRVFSLLMCSVLCSLTVRASATTLNELVNTVCQKANTTMTIDELATLLQQAKSQGWCFMRGAKVFPSVALADSIAIDGYKGRLLVARVIKDTGLPNPLVTETIRMRDKDLCVLRENDRVTVAYRVSSQSPEAFRNRFLNMLHDVLFSRPSDTIEAAFEFKNGDLQLVANQYLTMSSSKIEVDNFQCGKLDQDLF